MQRPGAGDDDFRELVLFACTTCDRCYILRVADDERRQDCPQNQGHGPMTVVNRRSDEYGYRTCATPACSSVLGLSLSFTNGKCESCNKPAVDMNSLVDGYGVLTSTALAALERRPPAVRTGSAAAAHLEQVIENATGFTTGHHKDKDGQFTEAQRKRHQKGQGANRTVKDNFNRFLEEAIQRLLNDPTYDADIHTELIRRAENAKK